MSEPIKKKPSKYTMVRVKIPIRDLAKKKADKQHRSIANYVETLIINDK